jgi:hypothetical protein
MQYEYSNTQATAMVSAWKILKTREKRQKLRQTAAESYDTGKIKTVPFFKVRGNVRIGDAYGHYDFRSSMRTMQSEQRKI